MAKLQATIIQGCYAIYRRIEAELTLSHVAAPAGMIELMQIRPESAIYRE